MFPFSSKVTHQTQVTTVLCLWHPVASKCWSISFTRVLPQSSTNSSASPKAGSVGVRTRWKVHWSMSSRCAPPHTRLWPLLTSRRRSTLRGWKRRWSDCTTLESEVSCGSCCPISSATQCPKFVWAMSCQISGWTRALLKGGSCPHFFSISWWTALQPRSSLLLQESSCLGTFSVGSRISCTLMIWCLSLTHHWTFRPP